jgi:hypothetical protein
MSSSPEIRYSFRFVPRDDASVDVWIVMSFADPSGRAPLGWLGETSTVELGPVRLSDGEATTTLRQLELAIEQLAEADKKRRNDARPSTEVQGTASPPTEPPPLGRPSELRLRR